MKEKIMNTMQLLKQDYYDGNISSSEYHAQLNGLNNTIFEMDRYKLSDNDVNPGEIQELIHFEQERLHAEEI